MIRLSFAGLAVMLMLTTGCLYHRHNAARSEYRTETTRTQGGNAQGTQMAPGTRSEQSETVRTRRESTTTEQSGNYGN